MPSKIRLVYKQPATLHWDFLQPILQHCVELVPLEGVLEPGDVYYANTWDQLAQQHWEQGHRVVFDNLWETVGTSVKRKPVPQGCHVLENHNWFWYQVCLLYRSWGYHEYVPQPQWTHHALMPLRRRRIARDYVVRQLRPHLDRFVWSYQRADAANGDRGTDPRYLPDDRDPSHPETQEYINPDWYNCTAMSLVVESSCETSGAVDTPFITEKTFKPMAFFHPFVVVGEPGTLNRLKQIGFETFENLFDEHYDCISNWIIRTDAVLKTALEYQPAPWDAITKQKLEHNHHHLYNKDLVCQRIHREILLPLIEYAKT